MDTTVILKTPRLLLRSIESRDAPDIQVIASCREIADTMISIPHPYPEGEAEKYIATRLTETKAGKALALAIIPQAHNRPMGMIELRDIEYEHTVAELSFWIAAAVWGQGYMSEALPPMLQLGFETLNLNRLYACHMVRNPASGRVLQRNGFREEGTLRQRVRKNGVFEDVKLWALLRSDWQNLSA